VYKITAVVKKPGGGPVDWMRFSEKRLTREQCEKMLSRSKEAGRTSEEKVTVSKFNCVCIKQSAKTKK
jgi:antisense regulator of RalR protein